MFAATLWAMVLLGRRARPLSIVGLVVTLPGLWLLTSPEAGSWNVGDSWTIACAIFFALHYGAFHAGYLVFITAVLFGDEGWVHVNRAGISADAYARKRLTLSKPGSIQPTNSGASLSGRIENLLS